MNKVKFAVQFETGLSYEAINAAASAAVDAFARRSQMEVNGMTGFFNGYTAQNDAVVGRKTEIGVAVHTGWLPVVEAYCAGTITGFDAWCNEYGCNLAFTQAHIASCVRMLWNAVRASGNRIGQLESENAELLHQVRQLEAAMMAAKPKPEIEYED